MSIALGFVDLALTLLAAEAHFHATDFEIGVGIKLGTGEGTFGLGGLSRGGELVIGLGGKLGCVFLESAGAFATAEVDLATFVIGGLIFLGWLARDGAAGLEWLGLGIQSVHCGAGPNPQCF